ncbi:MAG: ABC transporter permease [Bacteroidetes bacterium]|nr:ABC transporter permease [Bacteroidota bacterium]
MFLSWKIAWRYFRGKRSANVVPILSRISMIALAVGSGALIILFSIFNGFEGLIKELYRAFYPPLKITAVQGKFFSLAPETLSAVKRLEGIRFVTAVLEDNVLVQVGDEQQVATLKGIDAHFLDVNNIRPFIYTGADSVSSLPMPMALLGVQIAGHLGVDINNPFARITAFYPNAALEKASVNPQDAFRSVQLWPSGLFKIQDEFDGKYILAPLADVQQLFGQKGNYSSLEISVAQGANVRSIKNKIAGLLGSRFSIATRYEQNKTLYMVMNAEKWAVYGILVLVLLIASFNVVGALSLLVLEKQKDIAILKTMGANSLMIRLVFLFEGVIWAMFGGGIGLLSGWLICLGQQKYHWVKLQGSFIIDAYPVQMQAGDFAVVAITVCLIGMMAAWFPARKAGRLHEVSLRSD